MVGICNGFQVLTEAGLLPGALQKNRRPALPVHDRSRLRVELDPFGAHRRGVPVGHRAALPINHFVGSYVCDDATLAELRAEDRVVLRYVDNPNGSVDDIAGICNEAGNVVGLMPHPERAVDDRCSGSTDGVVLLRRAAGLPPAPPPPERRSTPPASAPGAGDAGLLEHGGAHARRSARCRS